MQKIITVLTHCILIRWTLICTFALLSQLFSVKVYLFTFLHLSNIELKLQSVEQIFYLPRSFFPHRCTQHIDAIKIAPLCSLRIKRNNFFVEFMSWMKKRSKARNNQEVRRGWRILGMSGGTFIQGCKKEKKKRFQLRCQNCRNFLALSVFLFLPFPIYFDF